MSSIGDKNDLLRHIRSIHGRFVAIEGAIEDSHGCGYVLQAISAARGSLDSLLLKVIEDHIRLNVIEQGQPDVSESVRRAEELLKLMHVCLRSGGSHISARPSTPR